MKELLEYRDKLMERLGAAADEFCAAALAVKDPLKPIEPGGWSVHQVAAHARDVQQLVYGARARRTLAKNEPQFANFDGEAYMAEHYDPNEPLRSLLDSFAGDVRSLLGMLRKMPQEGWSRLSSHETQGAGLTLQTWVERALEHIEEHLATIKRAS